jgi:2-succinyl-5-enolpyruvyl-6-hydroxy-3-cyclohexene-1-carboxylate synthase
VYSTRGASGIDGLLAQAVGSSLSIGGRTHLLIGDVSLQHDAGSLELIARLSTRINLQTWVFNNGGGKIFDQLPIRQHENILPPYFHTTPAVDFGTLAKAYSISSFKISTLKEFKEALAQPRSVSTLFEIRC